MCDWFCARSLSGESSVASDDSSSSEITDGVHGAPALALTLDDFCFTGISPETDEIERQEARIERLRKEQLAKDTLEFKESCQEANRLFEFCSPILSNLGIRMFYTMQQALEFTKAETSKKLAIFARDKPDGDELRLRLRYKKEYVVGTINRVFQYGHKLTIPLVLDEVVLPNHPSPIHFDIEMKQQEKGDFCYRDVPNIIEAHLEGLGYEMTGDIAGILGQAYISSTVKPFTEQQCKAGLHIIRDHIGEMIKNMLPTSDARSIEMEVLTGCRPSKFSLHILMKYIYCDSSVLSMPLVVYEIARSFVVQNTKWLVQNWQNSSASDEAEFRLRALMPLNMSHNDWEVVDPMRAEENDTQIIFKGYNDSPFDEAIYSAHHLLRAPGACKATGGHALSPVLNESSSLMTQKRLFSQLFPNDDTGFLSWKNNLIMSDTQEDHINDTYVIAGWKPPVGYPPPPPPPPPR